VAGERLFVETLDDVVDGRLLPVFAGSRFELAVVKVVSDGSRASAEATLLINDLEGREFPWVPFEASVEVAIAIRRWR